MKLTALEALEQLGRHDVGACLAPEHQRQRTSLDAVEETLEPAAVGAEERVGEGDHAGRVGGDQTLEDVELRLHRVARVAGAALGLDAEVALVGAAAAGADPQRARLLALAAVVRPVDAVGVRLIEDLAVDDLHGLGAGRPLGAEPSQRVLAIAANQPVAGRAVEVARHRGRVMPTDDDWDARRQLAQAPRHRHRPQVMQARPAGDADQPDPIGAAQLGHHAVDHREQPLERLAGDDVELDRAHLGQVTHVTRQAGQVRLVGDAVGPPALPEQDRRRDEQQRLHQRRSSTSK